jgi:hypothetical protein
MIGEVSSRFILKRCDGILAMFNGSISMKKSGAFIPKLDPFNYAPLLPINLLLMKEFLQLLRDNLSKIPFFKG